MKKHCGAFVFHFILGEKNDEGRNNDEKYHELIYEESLVCRLSIRIFPPEARQLQERKGGIFSLRLYLIYRTFMKKINGFCKEYNKKV